jgi:hypothetical protein
MTIMIKKTPIEILTESHLDDTVLSRDIQIQGYHDNILRKYRNCFGGGVLVYISETLKVKRSKSIFRSPVIMTFVV